MKYFNKLLFSSIMVTAIQSELTFAAPAEITTHFGSAWSGIGFVLGYGNEEAYVKYACGGTNPGTTKECDGPPRIGLIRKFASITDGVVTALNITACKDVPASGSQTVKYDGSDVTVNFETPKLTIPAAWTNGGKALDKRIAYNFTFAGIAIKAVVEASCGTDQTTFMSMNMNVGSQAPGFTRPINLWVGEKNGLTVADVYTIEKNSSNQSRSSYAFNVEIDETNKTYVLNGAQTNHFNTSNTASIDVFNTKGNFSSHQVSVRAKRFVVSKSDSSTSNVVDGSAAIASMTGSDDALLSDSTAFTLLTDTTTSTIGPVAGVQGCMDFDTSSTAPTSAAACSGLDYPTAVSTPVLDSSGKFSAKWLMVTLPSKLVEVPTL